MRTTRKLALIAALAAGSLSSCPAAGAAAAQNAAVHSEANSRCPSHDDVNAALSQASTLMVQAHYQDAAEALKPLADLGCDARASLLLAAAIEAGGDAARATGVQERAHAAWPLNTSIAASLAREYLHAGQTDKAAQALKHFQVTSTTPQQEMEEAALAA